MKKKLSGLILIMALGLTSKAQLWIDLGVKAGFTPGISMNSNVFNDENYKLGFASGYQYGGKLGVNFNPEHAVAVELLMTTLNTKTTIGSQDPNTLTLNYMEIPVLYRFNKENGGYSELGPVFGILKGANANNALGDFDVKEQFVETNYGLMIGFGQYIGGGNLFGLNLGFRLAYTFNDIIGTDNQSVLGNAVYSPSDLETIGSFEYKKSNNLYAGIVLEFNFNLGYFVKGSGCKKNTRFKLF